ncbi:MAG TPA: hypothetical protein VMU22_16460 [Rhizomicrobium sp.]|nr:hypothetical protein [Rhizomicrobium sp.]
MTPDYKLYCVDGGGHVVKRHDAVCANDLEAFKKAHDYCGDYEIEVWAGRDRLYVVAKGAKLPPVPRNGA